MNATFPKLLSSALVAALATPAAVSAHEPEGADQAKSPMAGHSAGSMEMHRLMAEGKKTPMPEMSGDVDKDFATMMSMHHQQGIKRAEVELQYGKNAELKALAATIKTAQQDEVEQMAPYTK